MGIREVGLTEVEPEPGGQRPVASVVISTYQRREMLAGLVAALEVFARPLRWARARSLRRP